jgi:hypothetical protein
MRETIEHVRITCDLCGEETIVVPVHDKDICRECSHRAMGAWAKRQQDAQPSRQDRLPDAPEAKVEPEPTVHYHCLCGKVFTCQGPWLPRSEVICGWCGRNQEEKPELKAEAWMLKHGKEPLQVGSDASRFAWYRGLSSTVWDASDLQPALFDKLHVANSIARTGLSVTYPSREAAKHALGVALLKLEAEKAKGTP